MPVDAGVPDAGVAGNRCQNALPATAVLSNQTTIGFGNDYDNPSGPPNPGCNLNPGEDRVYSLVIPPLQRVEIDVDQITISGSSAALVLGSAAACDVRPIVCAARTSPIGSGITRRMSWYNKSANPQGAWIMVDAVLASGSGTFDLTTTYFTVPVGDRCERAITLQSGVSTSFNTSTLANDYQTTGGVCSPVNAGNDAVFSIDVPGGQGVTFTVTPAAGLDTSLSLSPSEDDCARRYCYSSASTPGAGQVDRIGWSNPEATARTIFVTVDAATGGGSFDIVASLSGPILCGALTCANGCCSQGACFSGGSSSYCGRNGTTCMSCGSGMSCNSAGQCQ